MVFCCKGQLLRLLSLRQHKSQAGTWQYVPASNPPSERVAPAVIDAKQRIWIFGGFRYAGRYQGRGPQGQSIGLQGMRILLSSTSWEEERDSRSTPL